MKVNVYSSYCDYSSSMDIEYDASNKDEAKEAEKYLELYLDKETTDNDLMEMIRGYCVTPAKE